MLIDRGKVVARKGNNWRGIVKLLVFKGQVANKSFFIFCEWIEGVRNK